MRYSIGVDLGATNIAVGVVDENCAIIGRSSAKVNLPKPPQEVISDIVKVAGAALDSAGLTLSGAESIGIGTPGIANVKTGLLEFSCNFAYHNVPLRDMLHEATGLPSFLENDANAAAYGEQLAGGAKGASTAVIITLGTGLGGGVIIDGKIFSGFNCAGTEVGHTVIVYNGRPCNCGRRGCFEKYAAATALAYDTKLAMVGDKNTVMWQLVEGDINKVDAKTAFDAMKLGDACGKAVVEQYLDYLACGTANLINIFQPEIFCIGGGVSKEGEYLTVPLQKRIDEMDYARNSEHRTMITTAVLRNDAGIVGAAKLHLQQEG